MEKERLERENSRRTAKNLPAVKSIEDLDKAKDTSDPMLDQAAQVMADVVTGARGGPGQKTAARSDQ